MHTLKVERTYRNYLELDDLGGVNIISDLCSQVTINENYDLTNL